MTRHLFTLCAAAFCCGCGGETPATPTPAEQLEARLAACVDHGLILFGHQDDLFYGKNWKRWDAGKEHSDVRAVAGDYPAVLGVELGGLELGDSLSIDGIPFEMIRQGIIEHHRRGGITTASWHPANPVTGGNSWDIATAQGTVARILDGGDHHALYAEWLKRMGDFFASLKDETGEPIPIVWRPWHEMAGHWFWWGAPYCTPDEYKSLWNETHDYLQQERGLTNLLWAVSPGFTGNCDTGYTDYYPGDERVDLIGIDIYQYGSDADFTALVQRHLTTLATMAAEHGKLLALTETGYEGIPNPEWWSKTLLPAIEGAPIAYVLTWRNAWDREAHFYGPYEGHVSAEDFRTFCADPRIGLLNDLNKLEN